MTWEQHRYAIERAARRLKEANDAINDCCVVCDSGALGVEYCRCEDGPTLAGMTLQGEALSSDAEMLDDVADFLQSLDGSKADEIPSKQFVDEWNRMIGYISVMTGRYGLPKPEMLFEPEWIDRMSQIAGMRIQPVLIYGGVKVRFGRMEQADVFRTRL